MKWLTNILDPVPVHRPYKEHTNLFIIGYGIVLAIVLTLAFTRCSYSKKVAKTYERGAQYSPITTKDSSNAAKIGKKVIKDAKPRIIPGKTIIKKVPYDKLIKVLDTSLVNHIADSLTDNLISQTENYNTNIDEVIKGCNDRLKKATQIGYNKALDSMLKIKLNDDTIPPDDETQLDLTDCSTSLRIAQTSITEKDAQIAIYKKEAKDRFWIIILLGAGLLTSLFFNVKKSITKLNTSVK